MTESATNKCTEGQTMVRSTKGTSINEKDSWTDRDKYSK